MLRDREVQHAEAFCHMHYLSDDRMEEAWIWNSRDGVTPFVITLPSGKTAVHTSWNLDRFDPDHKPQPGELIFVDLTPENARIYARQNAERHVASGTLTSYRPDLTQEELEEQLYESYIDTPGAPDLVRVGPNGEYEVI